MASCSFQHDPLPNPSSSIRVIRILPNSTSELIKLSIEVVPLTSAYKCLSYVWGTDVPSHTIEINDQPLLIRKNLHDFLVEGLRRNPNGTSALWIDAVSINQDDIDEKNIQVAMMGSIYKNATRVIAWLGVYEKRLYNAVEMIKAHVLVGKASLKNPRRREKAILVMSKSADLEKYWHMFDTIAASPYFSRLWIVQEMILAEELVLWHGDLGVPSQSLENLCEYISARPGTGGVEDLGWRKVVNSPLGYLMDRRSMTPGKARLEKTFREVSKHGCQNVLDRIYALKALDARLERLPVNYSQDPALLVPQVYTYGSIEEVELGHSMIETMHLAHGHVYELSKDSIPVDRMWKLRIQEVGLICKPTSLNHHSVDWDDLMLPTMVAAEYCDNIKSIVLQNDGSTNPNFGPIREGDIIMRAAALNIFFVFRAKHGDFSTFPDLQRLMADLDAKTPEHAMQNKASDLEDLQAGLQNYRFSFVAQIRPDQRWRVAVEPDTEVGASNGNPLALEGTRDQPFGADSATRLGLEVTPVGYKVLMTWRAMLALWRLCDEDGVFRDDVKSEPVGTWEEEVRKQTQ